MAENQSEQLNFILAETITTAVGCVATDNPNDINLLPLKSLVNEGQNFSMFIENINKYITADDYELYNPDFFGIWLAKIRPTMGQGAFYRFVDGICYDLEKIFTLIKGEPTDEFARFLGKFKNNVTADQEIDLEDNKINTSIISTFITSWLILQQIQLNGDGQFDVDTAIFVRDSIPQYPNINALSFLVGEIEYIEKRAFRKNEIRQTFDNIPSGTILPKDLLEHIVNNHEFLDENQFINLMNYASYNSYYPQEVIQNDGVRIPIHETQIQLEALRQLHPRELTKEVLGNLRQKSDSNRVKINNWLLAGKNSMHKPLNEAFWELQAGYFEGNSAMGFMASSYLAQVTPNFEEQVKTSADLVVGKLREKEVSTGHLRHICVDYIPYMWSDLISNLTDNLEVIQTEIDMGQVDRIIATFMSLIIGHYPLEASGRVNEDFLHLVSGGKITISESGYRGFQRTFFDRLKITNNFKREFTAQIKAQSNGILKDEDLASRNPLYSMLAYYEHLELIETIKTGEFTESMLQRYPSIVGLREFMKDATQLKYQMFDPANITTIDELDSIVADVLFLEACKERPDLYQNTDPTLSEDAILHKVNQIRLSPQLDNILDYIESRISLIKAT